jgi:hypothetical protein
MAAFNGFTDTLPRSLPAPSQTAPLRSELQRSRRFLNSTIIGKIGYGVLKVVIGIYQGIHLSVLDGGIGLAHRLEGVWGIVSCRFNLSYDGVRVEVSEFVHRLLKSSQVAAQSSLSGRGRRTGTGRDVLYYSCNA